jgi:hypothetical protein
VAVFTLATAPNVSASCTTSLEKLPTRSHAQGEVRPLQMHVSPRSLWAGAG